MAPPQAARGAPGNARALAAVVCAGAALRVAVYALPSLQQTLASRPELTTAVSSFQRVRESAFLFDHVGSPYAGDVFHQPPLVFALFYPLLSSGSHAYALTCALFICVDVLLALGFVRLARRTLLLEEGVVPKDAANKEIWLHRIPVSPLFLRQNLPVMAAFMYVWMCVWMWICSGVVTVYTNKPLCVLWW